jgi:hypothetical protein
LDEGPWDVDEQLGMEKCGLYLEGAEEDMRRGLQRAADQLEKQWRDWSTLQTLVRQRRRRQSKGSDSHGMEGVLVQKFMGKKMAVKISI